MPPPPPPTHTHTPRRAVGADFSGSVLNIGCFDKADVSYSKFIGASVPDSTFNNTVIKGTDFTGALGTLKADFYHAIGVPLVCDGCNYPGSGLAALPAPVGQHIPGRL